MERFEIHLVSGRHELVDGVPIEGTPFFAHQDETASLRWAWKISHRLTGFAIGCGWYEQNGAVCSVRTWYRGLDEEVRAKLESVTADGMDEFRAWMKPNARRVQLHALWELCDFTWQELPEGGI